MRVVITGLGLRCALGDRHQAWQKLQRGESAIQLRQPFRDLSVIPVAMLGKAPVDLETLRRSLVEATLVDAGLEPPLEHCGIVIGSSRGFQGQWEKLRYNDQQGHQRGLENWLTYLPNQLAIATAQQVGSQGPVLAPMGACTTGLWAIAQGFELLQRGDRPQVLAGAVESPVTPLSITGFQKMAALATTGCFPFDQRREGLVLGEGGAIFLLETLESAQQRNAKIYGEILSWSFTCDAHHMNAPQGNYQVAMKAIAQCLERAGLEPENIDHIHPHGTSTRLNDQAEATMIETLFPHRPFVSGSKGATGHTLGASGALGVAFSLLMLRDQRLFPCVGLEQSEFDLNFVTKAQNTPLQNTLCFSFGFGGQNGAIALQRFHELKHS
ncbi:beta-ketoacyl-ACP synthase [Picosynechococcus sp. PCC 11901]|uniref:beta-ketoacyl-ACP synthase n=1 Tax=Picosynechococcus sp. PCC 11901 TaxID=2579791 RepID=UPI0028F440AE|nr:beta-ketoacyl-ACP synthase [Picosynechococcus sp. PCC 11901]